MCMRAYRLEHAFPVRTIIFQTDISDRMSGLADFERSTCEKNTCRSMFLGRYIMNTEQKWLLSQNESDIAVSTVYTGIYRFFLRINFTKCLFQVFCYRILWMKCSFLFSHVPTPFIRTITTPCRHG